MLARPVPQHTRTPPQSPARKRQRMSSPSYDDQLDDLSAEDLEAFDQLDFSLSQASQQKREIPQRNPSIQEPSTDPDCPFFVSASHISKPTTSKTYPSSFKAASSLSHSSPRRTQAPPDDWTAPSAVGLPLFRSARAVDVNKITQQAPPSPEKENVGIIMPSKKALDAARAKLKLWEAEDDVPAEDPAPEDLSTVEVAPPKFVSPVKTSTNMPPPASTPLPPTTFKASQSTGFRSQARPFRPLTVKNSTNISTPSLRNTNFPSSQLPQTPKLMQFSTPARGPPLKYTPKLMTSTPLRSIGLSKNTPSSFASPFKSPLHPASSRVPSTSLLKTQFQNRVYPPAGKPTPSLSVKRTPQRPPELLPALKYSGPVASSSKTLESSGLRPQEYDRAELEAMGLNVEELAQVNPSTALHYSFYSFDAPSDAEPALLNAAAAYNELLKHGCLLATEEWVNNHWSLILWKLAGMAALDPSAESTDKKRWCWSEVMKQLRHRYDVELEGGRRPILRKIVARDAAATVPMTLCVSGVIQTGSGHPMLEVTDGWYRLRAEIDAPLARAVKKGVIRVGRKIAVSGARLNSDKKDGAEILEAGTSVTLKITGNSSNLAPWYAKLGAQRERYISTLHSLTPDGGVISCLDVEVVKVHPIGYIEFVVQDGRTLHLGPRNEADEAKEAAKWEKRRDAEVSKLRDDNEKRASRYMDYLARLERKAEKSRPTTDDDEMPDSIMSYYDDLEGHSTALEMLATISPSDARWLAQMVRQNFESEQERMNSEIEKELVDLCPPRNVRNFRVVVVKDARTERRSAHRLAQLTVWDANSIDMSEGSTSGTFAVGQRYLVSNLVPTQQGAWMGNEPGAEVFMATRKDSQWVKRRSEVV